MWTIIKMIFKGHRYTILTSLLNYSIMKAWKKYQDNKSKRHYDIKCDNMSSMH